MTIPSAGEDMEQLEHSYIAGGCTKCYRHSRQQFGNFLQRNIRLLYNPAIPLLGIYPGEMKTYIHAEEFMVITALLCHLFAVCCPGNSRPELVAASVLAFLFRLPALLHRYLSNPRGNIKLVSQH